MLSYVHYTDNLPANVGGCANGPLIRIKHKYRDDKGIHAHEKVHVGQWWMWVLPGALAALVLYPYGNFWWYYALCVGFGSHSILYMSVHRYRLWCEVKAYQEQLKHYPDDRTALFAEYIATHYKLKISAAEAQARLRKT